MRDSNHDNMTALVREYFARSVSYCGAMLGSREEGEEVAQTVFVKLWERGRDLREFENPLPYLYQILRNACIDHLRRNKTRRGPSLSGEPGLEPADGDEAMTDTEHSELRETVTRALRGLEQSQREVVVLRFFEGQSLSDIAHITGQSLGAVAMKLSRAKIRLKEILGRLPEFEG